MDQRKGKWREKYFLSQLLIENLFMIPTSERNKSSFYVRIIRKIERRRENFFFYVEFYFLLRKFLFIMKREKKNLIQKNFYFFFSENEENFLMGKFSFPWELFFLLTKIFFTRIFYIHEEERNKILCEKLKIMLKKVEFKMYFRFFEFFWNATVYIIRFMLREVCKYFL